MTVHLDRRLEQLAREIAAKSQPKAPTKGLTGPGVIEPANQQCTCPDGTCVGDWIGHAAAKCKQREAP